MTNTINISVTNSNMSPRFIEVGAEGQEGIIKLSLSFDDGWSGLAKSVVFYDKRRIKTVSYDFLGFDSCEVEIPSVILSEDGRHPFIVVGSEIVGDNAETAREIPRKITECAFICVGDSIYPELNSTAIEALDTDAYSSFLEAYSGCLATAEELKEQYSGLAEKVGEAEGYANSAKSYAVGGTGTRENEGTDNAKYYSELSGASATEAKASEKAANDAKEIAVSKAGETEKALSDMRAMYSQGQSDISAQREAAERAKVDAEKAKTDAEKAKNDASGYAATCGENASNSGLHANMAWASADKAQSYAVGHTGTRDNENTDNAKYYSEVAKNAAVDLETSVASAEAFKVAAQKSAEEANTAYESASEIIGAATEEVNTAKAKTFEARDNAFYAKNKAESARDEAVEVSEKLSGIINNCAKLSDNNIFNGNNTFSNPITVSTPTDDAHAATKKYVDDAINVSKPGTDIIDTIGLNEIISNTALTSVCDYTIKGNTIQAAYGLGVNKVLPNGVCFGKEIPMLTTCGDLKVIDSDDNVKFTYRLEGLIGYRNIYDIFSSKGLYKNWSRKYYLTKLPVSSEKSIDYDTTKNITHTWEFTEDDFKDTGIPIKSDSIPFVSACFYSGIDAQAYMNDRVYFAQPYPAIFYYDSNTNKYILKCKGVYDSIKYQLTVYSKVYFYYQLETPYIDNSCMFAMGLNQGDKVTFECDYTSYQFFLDNKIYGVGGYGSTLTDYDFTPIVEISIPQSAKNALQGFDNVSRFLNNGSMNTSGGGAFDYSWIGEGNETVDYTSTIKNKLVELNNVGGGTLCFGSGIYTISESIIVPANINIIGNKETIIAQKTDNTHALILNGNNILIQDLTIKLLGTCTELTACIYANSDNSSGNSSTYNSKYPSNMYVQNINLNNITCIGNYSFKYDTNGYAYIDDDILNYRGVGIYAQKLYFNFVNCTIRGSHLYSTVYGGGGGNKYTIFATECRMALWENCGNSQYNILGHTYYANSSDTESLSLTDYVAYVVGENNIINITFYDTQHCKESIIYFDALSMKNRYNISTYKNVKVRTGKEKNNNSSSNIVGISDVIDLGRSNSAIPDYSDIPFSISNVNTLLSGFTTSKKLDGFYNNVLSGVGIWGNISSNITWTNNGISLEDICRYPKDIDSFSIMPSIISTSSPSENNPIEITIDFHNNPIITQDNIWIEFDNRYVGFNANVYFDRNNDANFTDVMPVKIEQNYDKVAYYFNYQLHPSKLYRIKIEFTTALHIENLKYMDFAYNQYEQEYNPNNYIGIVNIGMSSPGLSQNIFLNSTGGKLYGDIDLQNNFIKLGITDTLPEPSEDYRGKYILLKDNVNRDRLFACLFDNSEFKWIEFKSDIDNVLTKDNTTEYAPITDYNPATKKYVDESKSDKISKLEAHTTDTNNPHNVTPEQIGTYTSAQIDAMLASGGGGYKKIGYTDDCDYKVSASEGGKAAFEAAISAASDGDTIIVLAGNYGGSGTLTFKKNLTFVGIGNPVISFPITVANDSVFNYETSEWVYLDNEYTTNWSGFTFERGVESIIHLCTDVFYVANTLNASNCIFQDTLQLCGKLYNCKLFKGVKSLGYSGFAVGGLYLYDCDMLSENISGDGNTYIYGGTYRFKNSENTIASSYNLAYWQGAELYTYGCTFSGNYGYNNGGIDKCISGCTIYSDSNPFDASHCENCVLVTVTPIS